MAKRVFFLLFLHIVAYAGMAQVLDVPFQQASSVKYMMAEDLKGATLKKLLVDYNDIVYVLTDKGLYRDYNTLISKDVSYRSLSDKIPVDITLQEGSGKLFYLFSNQFLTNTYAGTLDTNIPENTYQQILVNRNLDILLVGDKNAALYHKKEKIGDINLPKENILHYYTNHGQFYALSARQIFRLEDTKWKSLHQSNDLTAIAFQSDQIYVGTKNGYYVISDFDGQKLTEIKDKLPVPAIEKLAFVGMDLWFTTKNGAFKEEPDRYRYFESKRWLNENHIIDMASDRKGNIYFLTPTGLNKVEYITQTLAEKAELFQDRIRKNYMRYGFVCAPNYTRPLDHTSAEIIDYDNDGLWTSFYLGSQVFRYATTGEPIAKQYVWESFEAFERILTINPLKGFPSRTFERTGYKVSDKDRWRPSPEAGWEWKGHTSSDEFIAYLFVGAIMDQFMAVTPEEKQRVAQFIDAIMTHIIENNYYFVDADGEPTLWGRWNPEYVNMFPPHVYDRKLNSTHLIAGLQLAYSLTNKEIYKKEAFKMMDQHGYHANMLADMRTMRADTVKHHGIIMGESWNHSDDEMAFFTYWVLYHYAFNPDLKKEYVGIIRNHWEVELPERNAAWHTLTYGTSGDIKVEDVLWHLREFPLDLMEYAVHHSHRQDLEFLPDNFRGQTTKNLITPGEQRRHRHNANPFILDEKNEGRTALTGDEFLLPYWMARYLGVIK